MNALIDRRKIEKNLVEKVWQDNSFKQELFNNPRLALEKANISLPNTVKIHVVEENINVFYLVLPAQPSTEEELSDIDLDAIVGGAWHSFGPRDPHEEERYH